VKRSKPWLRKSDGQYCCDLDDGTRLPLGKNKRMAERRWKAIMRQGDSGPTGPSIHELVDDYEVWFKANRAATTYDTRRWTFDSIRSFFPDMPAEEIKPPLVLKWIDTTKAKSPTTIAGRITELNAILQWGVKNGILEKNPIAGMDKPSRRVRQDFLPRERFQELFDAAGYEELREFFMVMLDSGARVEEMLKFEAQHFTGDSLVLPIDQSKGRRRSRRIYLPPVSLGIVKKLVEKHPTGKLFRNSQGGAMTRDALKMQCRRIREKMGLPALCATMLRHSFAHAKLTNGEDPVIVAKLMGHTDTRMLYTRYGHLDNSEFLRDRAMASPLLSSGPAPVDATQS
jgi:integrase